MKRLQAIKLMKEGKKITHDYFSNKEWMTMENDKIVTEEGYKHNAREFWSYRQLAGWNDGYSLYVA